MKCFFFIFWPQASLTNSYLSKTVNKQNTELQKNFKLQTPYQIAIPKSQPNQRNIKHICDLVQSFSYVHKL